MSDQQSYEELAQQLHGLIRTSSIEYIICAAIHFEDGQRHDHRKSIAVSGGFIAQKLKLCRQVYLKYHS